MDISAVVICFCNRSYRLCINFALLSLLTMKNKGIILLILFFGASAAYGQCPMCKTALKSSIDSGKGTVGNGINKGILFLLTMPYVLAGTAGFVYYQNRKKQKNA